MRRITSIGFSVLTGTIVVIASASGQTNGEATPKYDVGLPTGYRDWPLISIATVGAPVSDMRAKLGNEVAMKAFRDGTLPFPDGTIIARLAWKQTTSEENNRALGPAAENRREFEPRPGDVVASEHWCSTRRRYSVTPMASDPLEPTPSPLRVLGEDTSAAMSNRQSPGGRSLARGHSAGCPRWRSSFPLSDVHTGHGSSAHARSRR